MAFASFAFYLDSMWDIIISKEQRDREISSYKALGWNHEISHAHCVRFEMTRGEYGRC